MLTALKKTAAWLVAVLAIGFVAVFLFVQASAAYFRAEAQDPADLPTADVIVVLSAGLEDDKSLDPATRSRTLEGIALWKAGVAPMLALTGGYDQKRKEIIAERMAAFAIAEGVPPEAISLDDRAVSTFENARFTYELADTEGWSSFVVVSDSWHLFRSWVLFEFWKDGRPFEIRALQAVRDPGQRPWSHHLWMAVREPLAYPFNALKIAAQLGLEAVGAGRDRTIR